MITARELVFGNWFLLIGTKGESFIQIDAAIIQSVYSDDIGYALNDLNGIPITKDILLACGFVHTNEDKECEYNYNIALPTGQGVDLFVEFDPILNVICVGVESTKHSLYLNESLKYLHELQGIYYFCSGGKELIYNPQSI